MRHRLAAFLAMIAAVAMVAAAGATLGYRAELRQLELRGDAALQQAADRLGGQVDRYRYLPALMARDALVVGALDGGAEDRAAANRMLETAAAISGALDIYVMDATGKTIAASNWLLDRSFLGLNFSWRPYFQRAMTGALGYYHAVGTTSGQRGFYFAYPVRGEAGAILGALAVKIDLGRIEDSWRGDRHTVFFSDERDVIFLSNRAGLVLKALRPEGAGPMTADGDAAQYAAFPPVPLRGIDGGESHGRRLWAGEGIDGVPSPALWLERPMPTLGMTGNILIDLAPARWQAVIWGGFAAALGALAAVVAANLSERRAALRRQLAVEESAKMRLEGEVRQRTAALTDAVATLEAEIDERMAAEAQLRSVQEQLIHAEKLRALGELSAGISHELNQPLTAIQTLAETGSRQAARGEVEKLGPKFERIAQLAQRGARIIRNLRAFARNEAEPAGDVDLVAVVGDALDILEPRLRRAGVEADWIPPADPVLVRGGKVRLQQVVVNLVSNASDAMDGQDGPRRVSLSIAREGGRVLLRVRDTGPGLADPGQVFDPFYTTKPVGEGLGLGLSISYGIVQSFGGAIRGENAEGGGAEFTVELAAPLGRSEAA